MQIVLNGEAFVIQEQCTLHTMLEQAQLLHKRIAVEVNQEIIPRTEHTQYTLTEGDSVEVIQAVGGG